MGSVALLAANSADTEHTSWWAWVLCGLLAIGCIAAGWFAFARSRATTGQGTRWFRLLCVHDRLWGEPSSRRISGDRLAGGLGLSLMDATLSTATVPTKPFGRGWLGDASATLVGVPEHAAARMPFAASGCGVWALPAEAPPVGAEVAGLAEQLSVPAAPGWFIGLTDAGEPMLVHPIPGATFAMFGTSAQLRALEGSMNWPEELFELRRFSGGAGGAADPREAAHLPNASGTTNQTDPTDPASSKEDTKTRVLLVEIPAAMRGSRHGSVGFAAAEDVLAQGRERLQLLGHPTVDVYIAVPPVGTGTILAHGEHREYFNFFAVTAPAPKPAPKPATQTVPQLAPKPAPQPVPQNAPVATPATAPKAGVATPAPARSRRAKHRRARANAHKHRFPHGAVSGSVAGSASGAVSDPAAGSASTASASAEPLPLPTGERLARVVSARSASSSSAG